MRQATIKELTQKVTDKGFMEDIKTISVIHNQHNHREFAVYFDDLMFMSGYQTRIHDDTDDCTVADWETFQDTLKKSTAMVLEYEDLELTKTWRKSYTDGGITQADWDRRTIFHPYNEPNEMFCIDEFDYIRLTGERDKVPKWKQGWLNWIKTKIINGGEESKCLI